MEDRFGAALAATLLFAIIGIGAASGEEPEWSVRLSFGFVFNFPTPLHIEQEGEPDIDLTARYQGRSFDKPLYYAFRVARWSGGKAWEVELVHQKLHLENKPPEVERFHISHGYNLLLVSRAWETRGFVFRVGGGGVITHPETTVRGKSIEPGEGLFDRGYYLSGGSLQAAAEKRADLGRGLFGALEGKLTASYARIPIEDGHADVPNLAVHGLAGLGYRF